MKKPNRRVHRCKVVAAGVDWLTCTSTSRDAKELLWLQGVRVEQASEREGERSTRWHANGYVGRKGAHWRFGSRDDSVCLQLSSQKADEEWLDCLRASENVTRLDLAVDTYFDPPVSTLSRQVYRDACHRPSQMGRPPKETLYVDTNGGSTLYVGGRQSENFGRLYDKGAKEKTETAGRWWRWEAELKGRVANAHSDTLRRVDDYRVCIVLELAAWFGRRTNHSYSSEQKMLTVVGSQIPTTAERQLHWLASAVRPTVARLVEHFGRDRVLHALDLLPQSAVSPGRSVDILKEA